MRELIEKIEAATEGSRELDAEIARLQGLAIHDEHFVRVTSYDGYPEGALSPIPRYTTSLDAALPGENIQSVWREMRADSERFGRWSARHYDEDGEVYVGYANTEPLARRAAALKAMEADNA